MWTAFSINLVPLISISNYVMRSLLIKHRIYLIVECSKSASSVLPTECSKWHRKIFPRVQRKNPQCTTIWIINYIFYIIVYRKESLIYIWMLSPYGCKISSNFKYRRSKNLRNRYISNNCYQIFSSIRKVNFFLLLFQRIDMKLMLQSFWRLWRTL